MRESGKVKKREKPTRAKNVYYNRFPEIGPAFAGRMTERFWDILGLSVFAIVCEDYGKNEMRGAMICCRRWGAV